MAEQMALFQQFQQSSAEGTPPLNKQENFNWSFELGECRNDGVEELLCVFRKRTGAQGDEGSEPRCNERYENLKMVSRRALILLAF